jgi:XTP/dITP diphosphohydrolase
MTIWLASGNDHKRRELSAIMTGHTLKLPVEGGIDLFDPKETGRAFVENALIKARTLRRLLEERGEAGPVLADDSGLCVDALEGRPGIYSARYGSSGGKKIGAPERNALLLEEVHAALAEKPGGSESSRRQRSCQRQRSCRRLRSCRFVCAMVLLFGEDRFYAVQETLEGELVSSIDESRGTGGFGYDPVVYLPSLSRTVAELTEEEKNTVSHRAKAGKAIARLLAGG